MSGKGFRHGRPSGTRKAGGEGARLIARRGAGRGSFEVRWQPHEELPTTALITLKAHSTVRPGDDDTAVILNAFTEALSDLIEAFSNEVGSEIAVVKQSLLNKLQSEGRVV